MDCFRGCGATALDCDICCRLLVAFLYHLFGSEVENHALNDERSVHKDVEISISPAEHGVTENKFRGLSSGLREE